MNRVLLLILVLVVAIVFAYHALQAPAAGRRPPPPPAPAPETWTVAKRDLRSSFTASGKVRYRQLLAVNAPVGGRLQTCHVRVGDMVSAGQVLVEVEPTELQRQQERAVLSRDAAQRSLAQLEQQSGPDGQQRRELKLRLADAEDALAGAKREAEAKALLVEQGKEPPIELERAQLALRQKQRAGEALQAQLTGQDAKYAQERQTAAAELRRAELDLQDVQEKLAQVAVKSPAAGEIVAVSGGLPTPEARANLVEIGAGTQLFLLADAAAREVDAMVSERDIRGVHRDQAVTVEARSAGRIRLPGQVLRQDPQGSERGSQLSYRVVVALTGDGSALRPGEGVLCTFAAAERLGVPAVPLRYVRVVGKERFCLLREGAAGRRVPVQTGIDDGEYVEILAGLEAGQTVLSELPAAHDSPAASQ